MRLSLRGLALVMRQDADTMQRLYIRAWLSWPLKYRFARSMLWVGWRGQDWFWLLIRQDCHRRFAVCVVAGALAGLLLAL